MHGQSWQYAFPEGSFADALGNVMAEHPQEEERRIWAEDRFKQTLRGPGYWSILRFVAAGLVVAAILVVAVRLIAD